MRSLVLAGLLSAFSLAHADALDDYVKGAMEQNHLPGVCLAVIPPGGEPLVRSYGVSNLETMTPWQPNTVFRIASLSKQFCAYSILQLVKQGKISESDTLLKFFPKGHPDWAKVTIKHLLAHRSGIAAPGSAFSYREEYSPQAYVDLLAKKPLAEEPGSTFRYNNDGYALLGLIVGQVTNSNLPEFVTTNIFKPAGMDTARYFRLEDVIPNRADAYRWDGSKYIRPLMIRPLIFHGSGGILLSMEDMVKYERALRKEEALDRSTLARQRETYDEAKSGYGAGWFVDRRSGKLVQSHTGGTFGFTSAFIREVDEGWTVIVFRSSEGGNVTEMAQQILKLAKDRV